MNVRNRRFKLASRFFSSARASKQIFKILIFFFFFLRTSSARARAGGGGGAARLFFFPCSADHERDWPPCKVVFFGLATNALNVRNNNNSERVRIVWEVTRGGLRPTWSL